MAQYAHINALGSTVVCNTDGSLDQVAINTPGQGGNTVTLSDDNGTIASIFTTGAVPIPLLFNGLSFTGSLTVVSANGVSADITVVYRAVT